MIDAKLVALSFIVLLAGAVMYVNTQKEERVARTDAGLEQLAGAQYDAPFSAQAEFVCEVMLAEPESWEPCVLALCDSLTKGDIDVDKKLPFVCEAEKVVAVSFMDIVSGSDWFDRGLSDPQISVESTLQLCDGPAAEEGDFDTSLDLGICGNTLPYAAATIAVEHWRFVNRVHLGKFHKALDAVCQDPAFADGCPEASAGFKPSPAGEEFAIECPDNLGVAVFNLLDLVAELDAIVLANGGEAEVTKLIYGKCSTGRRLNEAGVVDWNAPFTRARYDELVKADEDPVEEDPVEEDPVEEDPPVEEENNDNGAGSLDALPACVLECVLECASTVEGEDTAAACACSGNCDTSTCSTDDLAAFKDGRQRVCSGKRRELRSLLKTMAADGSLEGRPDGEVASNPSRALWGHRHNPHSHNPHGHNPHRHSPHSHSPHSHICKSQTEVDRGGCDDVCLGCTNSMGNQCFGRCGPGCKTWNACGGNNGATGCGTDIKNSDWNGCDTPGCRNVNNCGGNAHAACVWHDSYCGGSMMNKDCYGLMGSFNPGADWRPSSWTISNTAASVGLSSVCPAQQNVRHFGWRPVLAFAPNHWALEKLGFGPEEIEGLVNSWIGNGGGVENYRLDSNICVGVTAWGRCWGVTVNPQFRPYSGSGNPAGAMPTYGVFGWGSGMAAAGGRHTFANKCDTCKPVGWDGYDSWVPTQTSTNPVTFAARWAPTDWRRDVHMYDRWG